MKTIDIYCISTSLIKENYEYVVSFVDSKRKEKALKYLNEKDRLLSLGAAFLMKKYLPKGEIKKTTTGKPYLEGGPFFNISHSGEYVVLAIDPSIEVGIDIERIDEKKIETIKYVLGEEKQNEEDVNSLFRAWSNKESLIKCLSTSIQDIKIIKGFPLEGRRIINNETFYTKSTITNGYSLSLTLKSDEPININIKQVEKLED